MSNLSILDAAAEAPSALAFVAKGCSWSFADAAEACRPRVASLLRDAPRALALTPSPDAESLLWLYSAFAAGTPILTLHRRATPEEREHLIRLAGARPPPSLSSRIVPVAPPPVPPHRPLAFVPTSGSTGAPRLAVLSRRAAVASAAASAANLGWAVGDRWLLCLPLAHTGGLSIVVRCLLARACVLAFDTGEGGALSRIAELATELEQATLVSLVPSLLDALLEQGFRAPVGLRAALIGGAGCSPTLARRAHAAGVPLLTSYGLTETASQVVTRHYGERYEPLPERDGVVSSGTPLPGVELELRAGRIAIRSPSLFDGYLGEASELNERGFLLTNDRGERGPEGELYVRGRLDDTIVSGGENVDPLEVEAALVALSGVSGACVFATSSAKFGQVVTALLATEDARLGDPAHLAERLAGRLGRHKQPRRVLVVSRLPLTPSGKVDRRACARWFAEHIAADAAG